MGDIEPTGAVFAPFSANHREGPIRMPGRLR